jgi:hypothetical protein
MPVRGRQDETQRPALQTIKVDDANPSSVRDRLFFALRFAGLVVIARSLNPIPFRTRPLNFSAPMILRLKTRESRSLPGLPSAEKDSSSLLIHSQNFEPPPLGAAFSFAAFLISSRSRLRRSSPLVLRSAGGGFLALLAPAAPDTPCLPPTARCRSAQRIPSASAASCRRRQKTARGGACRP